MQFLKKLIDFLTFADDAKTQQAADYAYLSEATDLYDLEYRQRELDRQRLTK